MKKLLMGIVGALGAVLVAGAGPVEAQTPAIVIPIDTVITGGSLGQEYPVGNAQVPAGLVGQTCDVRAVAVNQASVHPNNDLVVRTGSSEVVMLDVERATDAITPASGSVVLGPEIDVFVRMGPSTVFSAGMIVEFSCTPPPTTTPTTQPTTTPTTQPTSSTASTTPGTQNPTTTAGRTSSGGSGSLPVTGGDSSRTAMVSLILVAGGAMLVMFARRRTT